MLYLPGIAGVVLTLGMAVDANVLINERIRQELRRVEILKKPWKLRLQSFGLLLIQTLQLYAALVLLETSGSGPIRGFMVLLCRSCCFIVYLSLLFTFVFYIALVRVADEKMLKWLYSKTFKKQNKNIN